jgi:excisionase family DNA binding protein
MKEDKLLWTIDQTAEQLSISSRTVRRMIERNELPSIRLGHSVRLPVQGIKEFIENQTKAWDNTFREESGVHNKGENVCQLNAKTAHSGGHRSPIQWGKELDDLLERPSARKRKR